MKSEDQLRIDSYLTFSTVLASLTFFWFYFFCISFGDTPFFSQATQFLRLILGLVSKFTFSRLKAASDSRSCLAISKILISRNLFLTLEVYS